MIKYEKYFSILLPILENHPNGISEFELIKIIKKEDIVEKNDFEMENNFSTFQSHFFLFHLLYKLRTYLINEKKYNLDIHCLKIHLKPITISPNEKMNYIEEYDSLSAYYLDWNNLESTSSEDVEQMISNFWEKYSKKDALDILGLTFGASNAEIKRKYRELVLIHHPDRGGEKEIFQQITKAMKELNVE